MIVYRLMNKIELSFYIDGQIDKIGKIFPKHRLSNNHKYRTDKKYVHMFRNLKYIDYIQYDRDYEYLATFDIPMIVLMESRGKGFYKKVHNGKFKFKFVREFAIQAENIKEQYFLGFEEINKFEHGMEDIKAMLKEGKNIKKDQEYISSQQ